jgi:hypothetical protein
MNFKRLLHQPLGKFFISVLLGLGLASLFRKVCKDKNCIIFKGPETSEIDGKVFKHGNKCYKYKAQADEKCDTNGKKVVDISKQEEKPAEEKAASPLLGMA